MKRWCLIDKHSGKYLNWGGYALTDKKEEAGLYKTKNDASYKAGFLSGVRGAFFEIHPVKWLK